MSGTDRAVVPVAGAAELLEEVLAAAVDGSRLLEAAAVLAAGSAALDLDEAAARSAADGRAVILVRHPSGAALAVRWFPPGVPTSIHGNGGWGIALVCAGSDRYERWVLSDDGTVALAEVRQLGPGECAWWGKPPDDIHRQEGLGDGALELIVVGAESSEPLTEYQPATAVAEQGAGS